MEENKPPEQTTVPDLIKTQEEIRSDEAKQNRARVKLLVFLGTIIVIIIVAVYVFKAGQNMQGSLTEAIEPQHEVAQETEFCPLNQFVLKSFEQCLEIPQDDCDLLDELKNDPIQYKIAPDTIKQDWWQEDCERYQPQTEVSLSIKEPQQPTEPPVIAEAETEPEPDQPIDCGKAKADASIYTDKGFIDSAYDTQNLQLTAEHCHPDYTACQRKLASAVSAQAYSIFAKSITRSTVYLQNQFDQNADTFYADPSCYKTQQECDRIKTAGVTSQPPSEEELPLTIIAPPTEEGDLSTSAPVSGGSPFSQEALEYNIEKTIEDNTLFTERQFYNRYCVPKPEPTSEQTAAVSEIPPLPVQTETTPKMKR